LRAKGLRRKEVLSNLKRLNEKDSKYADGKILCSMCTKPHPLAKKANILFSDANLGDPGLFPGTVQIEKEVISILSELLHSKSRCGFIVSGGTEANMLALYAAREKTKIQKPEVILPESAHFSFDKICRLLSLKQIIAKSDSQFRVDPSSVEQLINKNTIAVVANAGSSELGVIDPIEALSKISLKYAVFLHVDAAFGGLVIPFMDKHGSPLPDFDFKLEGVQSITVDPHKMGMSTIPAGGIIFRDIKILDYLRTQTPYLTEDHQYTFVGTRSGASVAATWASFESLGFEGFKKNVKQCMALTKRVSEGLENLGFELLVEPTINIVAFKTKQPRILVSRLRSNGWHVSYVPRLDCIRVVLMPHTRKNHVDFFLKYLKELRQR
jgi:tyrosine decarboxylase/aspartate 1-decarboxylase